MRYFLALFASLLLAVPATAQVRAKATVDSTSVYAGSQLRLYVDLLALPGAVVQPIDLEKLSSAAIEFRSQSDWDTLERGNGMRLRKQFELMAWDTGYHWIPAVPVVALQGAGRDTFFTQKIPLEVRLIPATEIADIKPIIEEPRSWRDYLPVLLAIGAVLFAALLIFLGLRLKTQREALPPPPPARQPLPHERALQALDVLEKENLWQQGQAKEYHTRLTLIVRRYLEDRYGIHALESTTDEIQTQMRKAFLSAPLTEKMHALLQTADLVKFAKAEPTAEYHERAMAMARAFVLETKAVQTESDTAQSPNPNHQSPT